jgi:hypothetical protein
VNFFKILAMINIVSRSKQKYDLSKVAEIIRSSRQLFTSSSVNSK